MDDGSRLADAVFEGGGVKGIGLVGAVVAAEERGYRWMNLAGTSAGAIVAALLGAGYTGLELREILLELDYRRFRDPWLLGRLPVAGPAISLCLRLGLYEGDVLEEWLRRLLGARRVRTFGDLVLPDAGGEPRFRYRVQVIAADVSRGELLVLPADARAYGINPDRLDVARAVRMSASLPYFYRPMRLRYGGPAGAGGQVSYIVDGGLLSSFPVWLFDVPGPPPWPTFGFRLVEPSMGRPRRITGPVSLLTALVGTMLEAHDARHIRERDHVRTIAIPTLGVGTVEFDLDRRRAEALYRAGLEAGRRFLDAWNFARYVEAYRRVGG